MQSFKCFYEATDGGTTVGDMNNTFPGNLETLIVKLPGKKVRKKRISRVDK